MRAGRIQIIRSPFTTCREFSADQLCLSASSNTCVFDFVRVRRNNHQNDLVEEMNATNTLLNGANGVEPVKNGVCENDIEMISQPTTIIEDKANTNSPAAAVVTKSATNGTANGYQNGTVHDDSVEDMGKQDAARANTLYERPIRRSFCCQIICDEDSLRGWEDQIQSKNFTARFTRIVPMCARNRIEKGIVTANSSPIATPP